MLDLIRTIDDSFDTDESMVYEGEVQKILEVFEFVLLEMHDSLSSFFLVNIRRNIIYPQFVHYFYLSEACNNGLPCNNIRDGCYTINNALIELGIIKDGDSAGSDILLHMWRDFFFVRLRSLSLDGFKIRLFHAVYNTYRVSSKKKVDVLYLNAGKLDTDFKEINNSMNAKYVPTSNALIFKMNISEHEGYSLMRTLIKGARLSIPYEILSNVFNDKIVSILPNLIARINDYIDFILKNNVKLVVSSALTHEDHLSLLLSAKCCGVSTLSVPHGIGYGINPNAEQLIDYQATIGPFEYRYQSVDQYQISFDSFSETKLGLLTGACKIIILPPDMFYSNFSDLYGYSSAQFNDVVEYFSSHYAQDKIMVKYRSSNHMNIYPTTINYSVGRANIFESCLQDTIVIGPFCSATIECLTKGIRYYVHHYNKYAFDLSIDFLRYQSILNVSNSLEDLINNIKYNRSVFMDNKSLHDLVWSNGLSLAEIASDIINE